MQNEYQYRSGEYSRTTDTLSAKILGDILYIKIDNETQSQSIIIPEIEIPTLIEYLQAAKAQKKPNITQQINDYVRSQQQLMKVADIKKANCIRQDNQSASNNQVTNPNVHICDLQKLDVTSKTNHLNQITLGVNQYVTV